jgi:hypothetical protein
MYSVFGELTFIRFALKFTTAHCCDSTPDGHRNPANRVNATMTCPVGFVTAISFMASSGPTYTRRSYGIWFGVFTSANGFSGRSFRFTPSANLVLANFYRRWMVRG